MDQLSDSELAAVRPVNSEVTIEARVAETLRNLIVEGKLRPGIRLPYREMATRLGVSVTPVRVSLRDLSNEGLVTISPRGTVRVTPLSVEEVDELYSARAGLESLLARRGVERLSDAGILMMKKRFPTLERTQKELDLNGFLRAVWEFRLPCYSVAARPRILEAVSVLVQRCGRYNFLALRYHERFLKALEYNQVFGDACAARDAIAAEKIIRESNDWSREVMVKLVASSDGAD